MLNGTFKTRLMTYGSELTGDTPRSELIANATPNARTNRPMQYVNTRKTKNFIDFKIIQPFPSYLNI